MTRYGAKVHPIDLGYMGQTEAAGAFLVENEGTKCLVESGPSACLPNLLKGLHESKTQPEELTGLLLTHIHLDHAGASGHLTHEDCHAHVHPKGARHLIDPEKLNASAYRVFGASLDLELGTMEPNLPDRVREVMDGDSVTLGTMTFKAIETPGHARHHHAWMLDDGVHSHLFCGDAAGMRIPGTDFPTIPMVPPEFDRDDWLKSIDRIEATGVDSLWLTHFGKTTIKSGFLDAVRNELNAEVDFLTNMISDSETHLAEKHRAWHEKRAGAFGVSPELLSKYCRPGFYRANYDGILRWLSK